ncbi:UNKNOWN [Stylonychia lemnae]|uniref:Uncharacterized protein n=1 Tax=Stylonychia lemnae TaxID=5949 RepID=A0A078B7G8_STYLE|nr:UNKNOWN [Stylonychia lemnae]|eukprot:CDW90440.1 UNKNOWN [Stylonychia lemnae]
METLTSEQIKQTVLDQDIRSLVYQKLIDNIEILNNQTNKVISNVNQFCQISNASFADFNLEQLDDNLKSLKLSKSILLLNKLVTSQQEYIISMENKYKELQSIRIVQLNDFSFLNYEMLLDDKIMISDKFKHLIQSFTKQFDLKEVFEKMFGQYLDQLKNHENTNQSEYDLRVQLLNQQKQYKGLELKLQQMKLEYQQQLELNYKEIQTIQLLNQQHVNIQDSIEVQTKNLGNFDKLNRQFRSQEQYLKEQHNIIQDQIQTATFIIEQQAKGKVKHSKQKINDFNNKNSSQRYSDSSEWKEQSLSQPRFGQCFIASRHK